jgi:hypothetical protein
VKLRQREYQVTLHVDVIGSTDVAPQDRFGRMTVVGFAGGGVTHRVDFEGLVKARYSTGAVCKALRDVKCCIESGAEIVCYAELKNY